MDITELKNKLVNMRQPWRDGIIPNYLIEQVVLDDLICFDGAYLLSDVMSRDMAVMLLREARRNEESSAGLLVIHGGTEIDIGRYKPLYEKLISQWLKKDWIRRLPDGGYELTNAFDS